MGSLEQRLGGLKVTAAGKAVFDVNKAKLRH
jgi:hypothetical protein